MKHRDNLCVEPGSVRTAMVDDVGTVRDVGGEGLDEGRRDGGGFDGVRGVPAGRHDRKAGDDSLSRRYRRGRLAARTVEVEVDQAVLETGSLYVLWPAGWYAR
ncbi:hypothetical protein QOZ89_45645 [Pseudofrankia sp. BMG5.37]|uniref:hypothetical protein n=1 Tax=Pseudofrankia sp. BMG5.36 TaxID=1834512 RepID=UPI001041E941|nr:hypothetical protein [Pseudofrankia sp. BMG5.36]MDT3446799.1 hypothetical protein [Pseudofrankia sp. BMG5.37]